MKVFYQSLPLLNVDVPASVCHSYANLQFKPQRAFRLPEVAPGTPSAGVEEMMKEPLKVFGQTEVRVAKFG